MIKPVGNNLLVKIVKKKSSIELLPGTSTQDMSELVATVEAVGTKVGLGFRVGHEIVVPAKMSVTLIEETDDYTLVLIPESTVPGIRNWSKEDEAALSKDKS